MPDHRQESFDIPRFIIRWLINAAAIWAAVRLVEGITLIDQRAEAIIVIALIFGLVNAIIRPILTLLTCPLIILTLGLGTLLVNTAMFALTGTISRALGYGLHIDGFWPAFFGALVASVVSILLSSFVKGRDRGHHRD